MSHRSSLVRVRHRRGMTLVEVLAVVVILGLLADTLAVGFSGAFSESRVELARTGVTIIKERVEMYQYSTGDLPSPSEGLTVLSGPDAIGKSYELTQDQLTDPWGRTYVFISPASDGSAFEIVCYGADGQPGGTGENQDISSRNLRGSN
ncbi:MAG: type II secretion system protein GspG [bacterium]|nr:type II secretion system protein GspG [bacterium]